MTEQPRARFSVNILSGLIEIEGPVDFVRDQVVNLEGTAKCLRELITPKQNSPGAEESSTEASQSVSASDLPDTFGELLTRLPKDADKTDKVLYAGLYVQKHSQDNSFRTRDVAKLLRDYAVKIGNPSQTLKNCVKANKLVPLPKAGKKEAKYRVESNYESEMLQALKR